MSPQMDKINFSVGDRLVMKKRHPCDSDTFTVIRVGCDVRIKCDGCGRDLMIDRISIEKKIKKVICVDK